MSFDAHATLPIRFSLVSDTPLPSALCDDMRTRATRDLSDFIETQPRVRDLYALSFYGTWTHPCDDDCTPRQCPALSELRSAIQNSCAPYDVDNAVLYGNMASNGPRLIVTDVDTTFITGEVIEMLAAEAGAEELVRDITTRAMQGELDFAASLRERVATLANLEAVVFPRIASRVELTDGADILVETAHGHNAAFGLVSGGFHEVVDIFAEPLDIDYVLANRLDVVDGKLTGKTIGQIIDRDAKARAVTQWAGELGISLDDVLVAGDGANDLGMMHIAGMSVAFRAKPVVQKQALTALSLQRLDAICALVGWDCH